MELSIGDYVLSGGDIAALAVLDACVRLIPGVMGKAESGASESFENGLLEYPHYTQPARVGGAHHPRGVAVGRPRQDRGVAKQSGPTHHPCAQTRPRVTGRPSERGVKKWTPVFIAGEGLPAAANRKAQGRETVRPIAAWQADEKKRTGWEGARRSASLVGCLRSDFALGGWGARKPSAADRSDAAEFHYAKTLRRPLDDKPAKLRRVE